MIGIRITRLQLQRALVLAICGLLLVSMLPSASVAAPAKQANLIANAYFEGNFAADGVGDNWLKWVVSGAPEYKQITSTIDARRVNEGSSAQQMQGSNISYVAGLQQTVAGLTVGKTYRFTIYAHAWVNTGDNADASTGTINLKAGIAPGNTYAADPNVTWSGLYTYTDTFGLLSVEAVATDTTATVFTHAATTGNYKHNDVYWDNAALVEVGAATTVPVATGVATAEATQAAQATLATGQLVAPTDFPVPTPDDSGQIIYYVQPNDSLVHIATVACGETMECVDKIKELNGLVSDIIYLGQRLVIGPLEGTPSVVTVVDPEQTSEPPSESDDTSGAAETADEDLVVADAEAVAEDEATTAATSSPEATGAICVALYSDANGNGVLDVGEQLVAEGIFSLVNLDNGETIDSYVTDGSSEPYCFSGLTSGTFRVISASPAGHTPTTRVDWDLTLAVGSTANLEFGAQLTGEELVPTEMPESAPLRPALIGAFGVVLLLSAAGIAGYLVLTRRG
ncbi:MAG: SdrD B-like domain-containing protein [Anaerolineales bacterium]|nr:SdrD B-like domain-containing protein [Anaerolineales bacterium]